MFTSIILRESSLMPFSHLHLHLFKPQHNTVNVLFSMHVLNDFQLNNYMQYINSIPCYQLLAFACISLFGVSLRIICVQYAYVHAMHLHSTYVLCVCNAAIPLACTAIKVYVNMNDSVVKGLSLRSFNSDLERALLQVSFFTLVII